MRGGVGRLGLGRRDQTAGLRLPHHPQEPPLLLGPPHTETHTGTRRHNPRTRPPVTHFLPRGLTPRLGGTPFPSSAAQTEDLLCAGAAPWETRTPGPRHALGTP